MRVNHSAQVSHPVETITIWDGGIEGGADLIWELSQPGGLPQVSQDQHRVRDAKKAQLHTHTHTHTLSMTPLAQLLHTADRDVSCQVRHEEGEGAVQNGKQH